MKWKLAVLLVASTASLVTLLAYSWAKPDAGSDRKAEQEVTPAPQASSVEQLILALEDEHRTLRGKGGEKFNADDYLAINGSGQVFDKAQGSDLYNSGNIKIESEEITDRKVRVFPETALVTDVWRYKALREGQERSGVLREARLWAKRQGNWQSVFWQATPILLEQQHRNPQSEAEAKIRRLENEWVQLAVHNDGAGYGRLLADEFISIRADGVVKTKADRIKAFSSGSIQTEVLELSDMQVRTYGNVAVVTGLATRKDTIDGKARDFQYRYTRVWILRDDKWQCVLMQSTTIGPLGGLSK